MCFKNLPIEFDATGKATLRQGVSDPWAVQTAQRKYTPLMQPSELSARWSCLMALPWYLAWADWLRSRGKPAPDYHAFGCIAYRHLASG